MIENAFPLFTLFYFVCFIAIGFKEFIKFYLPRIMTDVDFSELSQALQFLREAAYDQYIFENPPLMFDEASPRDIFQHTREIHQEHNQPMNPGNPTYTMNGNEVEIIDVTERCPICLEMCQWQEPNITTFPRCNVFPYHLVHQECLNSYPMEGCLSCGHIPPQLTTNNIIPEGFPAEDELYTRENQLYRQMMRYLQDMYQENRNVNDPFEKAMDKLGIMFNNVYRQFYGLHFDVLRDDYRLEYKVNKAERFTARKPVQDEGAQTDNIMTPGISDILFKATMYDILHPVQKSTCSPTTSASTSTNTDDAPNLMHPKNLLDKFNKPKPPIIRKKRGHPNYRPINVAEHEAAMRANPQ